MCCVFTATCRINGDCDGKTQSLLPPGLRSNHILFINLKLASRCFTVCRDTLCPQTQIRSDKTPSLTKTTREKRFNKKDKNQSVWRSTEREESLLCLNLPSCFKVSSTLSYSWTQTSEDEGEELLLEFSYKCRIWFKCRERFNEVLFSAGF